MIESRVARRTVIVLIALLLVAEGIISLIPHTHFLASADRDQILVASALSHDDHGATCLACIFGPAPVAESLAYEWAVDETEITNGSARCESLPVQLRRAAPMQRGPPGVV